MILPALSFLLQPKTFNSLTHEKTTSLLHCIFVIMDTAFLRSEAVVEKIIEIGHQDNQATHQLDILTNRFGGRPIGSDAYENAAE